MITWLKAQLTNILLVCLAAMSAYGAYAYVHIKSLAADVATAQAALATKNAEKLVCEGNAQVLQGSIDAQNHAVDDAARAGAQASRDAERRATDKLKQPLPTRGTGADALNKWLDSK